MKGNTLIIWGEYETVVNLVLAPRVDGWSLVSTCLA
jgi:hypothetical protein